MQKVLHAVQNYKPNEFLFFLYKRPYFIPLNGISEHFSQFNCSHKDKKKTLPIHSAMVTMATRKIQNSRSYSKNIETN